MCAFFLCIGYNTWGQTQSEKLTVFVSIDSFTATSVSFSWTNFSVNSTHIYRKEMDDINWVTLKIGLSNTTFTDTTIVSGKEYEYKFIVFTGLSNPSKALGYLSFGINVPKKTTRGHILVVLDDRFIQSLAPEIAQLQEDLQSDGWKPNVLQVSKDSSVTFVKHKIDSLQNIQLLSAIYLVGHIPVPYSGSLNPDGHTEHKGAWATDLYYVSNQSGWTDNTVNTANTKYPSANNVPGDGKFDLSFLSQNIRCPISRIDFFNLPSQSNSEVTMLANYLKEASNYKRGQTMVKDAGLIDNQLINFNEGFASNGYRNFTSLMRDTLTKGNMLTKLSGETYKWTYAVGYGTDTSISNIASISSLKNTNYKGIFSMVFGSYFGDWNSQNNLMRSLLADGKMLTTCWAGRPNWFFHHMGLNYPIALSAARSINNGAGWSSLNSTKYDIAGLSQNYIHMALLGDLSLRQNHKPIATNVIAAFDTKTATIKLTWDLPAATNIAEVEIYKYIDSLNAYVLEANLSGFVQEYTDTLIKARNNYFMRYISLDTTTCGSYYNNSLGAYINMDINLGFSLVGLPAEMIHFEAKKVDNHAELHWKTATEENVSHFEIQKSRDLYTWYHLDNVVAKGNSHELNNYNYIDYTLDFGTTYYRLKTVDYDGLTEYSETKIIAFQTVSITLYPNPSTNGTVTIRSSKPLTDSEIDQIQVIDMNGKKSSFRIDRFYGIISIEDRKGLYFIKILGETKRIILL
jgi:hypothetical protein